MKKPLLVFYFEEDNRNPPMGYYVVGQSQAAAARYLRQDLGRQNTTHVEQLPSPVAEIKGAESWPERAVLMFPLEPIAQDKAN